MKLYRLWVFLIAIMPVSIYGLYQALITQDDYDVFIKTENVDSVFVFDLRTSNDGVFLFTNDKNASIDGVARYYTNINTWGFYVDEKTVVKVNKDYFKVDLDNETLIEYDMSKEQKSNKVPMYVIVSIFGFTWVAFLIFNKSNVKKEHWRFAVLISLVLLTIVFSFLNAIVKNLMEVFYISLLSWIMYLGLYYYKEGKINKTTNNYIEDEVQRRLKDKMKLL